MQAEIIPLVPGQVMLTREFRGANPSVSVNQILEKKCVKCVKKITKIHVKPLGLTICSVVKSIVSPFRKGKETQGIVGVKCVLMLALYGNATNKNKNTDNTDKRRGTRIFF